jgi:hypothetical protein
MLRALVTHSVIALLLYSCEMSMNGHDKNFKLLDSKKTGLHFNNSLEETHFQNVITYADFYSGGGVSIGDIDNDGLSDIFFTGNQVPSKLFRNLGGMTFQDITGTTNLDNMGRGWYTGSTMVDINNDGYLDIYICRSGMEAPDDRANLLYINNGNGQFTEQAKEYGIAHQGFGVNATFFDYDKDGDLDMYLVNQGPIKLKRDNALDLRLQRHDEAGDLLYENVDGKYVDVTAKSGIFSSVIGFAHGVAIGDVNNDEWEDIFVSNDFFEYDYLYINNGDKTFTETIKDATNHISYYSMGNDMADFNNDGLLDIIVLDMVAENHQRLFSNLGGMSEQRFNQSVQRGLHYQYMFNVLHLNNGNNTFSDIGMLSGISKTDWSWAPVFADFDNDGLKDLYITNGIRKDIRNIDWVNLYMSLSGFTSSDNNFTDEEWDKLLNYMPSEAMPNYMFKNNGDLSFSQVMAGWGMDQKSWSNGAAYGDLDNDGDLDLVVNNIDQDAFLYENQKSQPNFIRFKFIGPDHNKMALGTKVYVYHGNECQYQQQYLTRGYRSSMEPIMHFGIGQDTVVLKIEVIWPDGKTSCFYDVSPNQVVILKYTTSEMTKHLNHQNSVSYFEDVTENLGIKIRHIENEMNDFIDQPLLPYKPSTLGPAFAVADVNNDGLDDLFLGGSFGRPAQLMIQDKTKGFHNSQKEIWDEDNIFEDVSATFIDIDNDNDLDLYVVSGGSENTRENGGLVDRIYMNNGNGYFTKSNMKLPNECGSVAVPGDFDNDGDADLFIGGRMVPRNYPLAADSYILANQNGIFKDITIEIAPELKSLGMVTDALWSDYDVDGDLDLIVVGEWMPITLFKNESGHFIKTENTDNGLEKSSGWWWTVESSDFDNDGDPDFIAGNMGFNYKFKPDIDTPLEMFSYDFDDDKSLDFVIGYHQDGKLYPVNGRNKTIAQNSYLEHSIPTNNAFSTSTVYDIYGEENLKKSFHLKMYTLATSYIENRGNGNFKLTQLHNRAQISNVNSVIIEDVDIDGNKDIIIAGNFYDIEKETIRNDGGIGLWLRGDGSGKFKPIPLNEGGLNLPGNTRHLSMGKTTIGRVLFCAKNSDFIQCIQISGLAD